MTDLEKIDIEFIGGNCPVQAEGKIDGVPFYFRARGSGWRIGIGGKPVGEPDWVTFGERESASWMLMGEARELIEKAAALWRSRGRPLGTQSCAAGPGTRSVAGEPDLQGIEARARAATAGPLVATPKIGEDGHGIVAQVFGPDGDGPLVAHFDFPNGTANAIFFAAARDDILALIQVVREQMAELHRKREEIERQSGEIGNLKRAYDFRVSELLEANNAEVERRRAAEEKVRHTQSLISGAD